MNQTCRHCKKNTHHDIIRGSIEEGVRLVRCEECGKKTVEDYTTGMKK